MDDLTPILQRIPLLRNSPTLDIEELSGGITNRNYKICTGSGCYVLRLGGDETRYLGIDRKTEHECSFLASQTGIAPRPVAFVEPEGYILSEFIDGKGIPAEEIGKEENIKRVVGSIKSYQALDRFPGSFSPFQVAVEYTKTARKFDVSLPDGIDRYLETSRQIEQAMYGREPLVPRPCHNDLLNGNFIDDGMRIQILDWEYAGMGDIFFDLGNFAVQNGFDDEQDELLLHAYFINPTDSQRARQKLMKTMSDLREAMWAQVQIGVSKLDFDYAGYGRQYFERFETSTTSREFSDWLRAC